MIGNHCTSLIYYRVLFQDYHDIANSFLAGADGVVYEGRAYKEGPHAYWNKNSLSLSFLGLFDKEAPDETSMLAAKNFLQYLVDQSMYAILVYMPNNCIKR